MKPIRLRRIARRDLREAVTWYRERDPELANRFLDEVYKALGMLERFPSTGGPVFGVDDPDTRQREVRRVSRIDRTRIEIVCYT